MKKQNVQLQFRTVQIGSPRQPDEGIRIGAVRFLPRGIQKKDYGKLDLFDLWLPILAPSRELLRKFRDSNMSFGSFSQRYRKEMKETDARQVIQLIVEMASKMPISLGCYCKVEAQCHRSILSAIVREAAGLASLAPLSHYCIYTILHPETLNHFQNNGGYGEYEEKKCWTSGLELFHQVKSKGERLPLVFGDATDCSRLIYWAQLDDIRIDSAQSSTSYLFSRLQPIPRKHSPQELTLISTGETIAEGFIRPYALVRKPDFLK